LIKALPCRMTRLPAGIRRSALRVDYAMPVSKAPYDVTQRLGFNAGPF